MKAVPPAVPATAPVSPAERAPAPAALPRPIEKRGFLPRLGSALAAGQVDLGASLWDYAGNMMGTERGASTRQAAEDTRKIVSPQTRQEIEDAGKYVTEKANWRLENAGKLADAIVISAATSVPQTVSAAIPFAGPASMIAAEAGRFAQEARAAGIQDDDLIRVYSNVYGGPSGAIEFYTDRVLLGLKKVPGAGQVAKAVQGLVRKRALRTALGLVGKFLGRAGSEGLEEVLQGSLSDVLIGVMMTQQAGRLAKTDPGAASRLIANRNQRMNLSDMAARRMDEFVLGATAGAVLGLHGTVTDIAEMRAQKATGEKPPPGPDLSSVPQQLTPEDQAAMLAKYRARQEAAAAGQPIPDPDDDVEAMFIGAVEDGMDPAEAMDRIEMALRQARLALREQADAEREIDPMAPDPLVEAEKTVEEAANGGTIREPVAVPRPASVEQVRMSKREQADAEREIDLMAPGPLVEAEKTVEQEVQNAIQKRKAASLPVGERTGDRGAVVEEVRQPAATGKETPPAGGPPGQESPIVNEGAPPSDLSSPGSAAVVNSQRAEPEPPGTPGSSTGQGESIVEEPAKVERATDRGTLYDFDAAEWEATGQAKIARGAPLTEADKTDARERAGRYEDGTILQVANGERRRVVKGKRGSIGLQQIDASGEDIGGGESVFAQGAWKNHGLDFIARSKVVSTPTAKRPTAHAAAPATAPSEKAAELTPEEQKKSDQYGLGNLVPAPVRRRWIRIYERIVQRVAKAMGRNTPPLRLSPRLASIASTDGDGIDLLESLAEAHERGDVSDGELAFIVAHELGHIAGKHEQGNREHEIAASMEASVIIERAGFQRKDAVSALRKIRKLKADARARGEINVTESDSEARAHDYYEEAADQLDKPPAPAPKKAAMTPEGERVFIHRRRVVAPAVALDKNGRPIPGDEWHETRLRGVYRVIRETKHYVEVETRTGVERWKKTTLLRRVPIETVLKNALLSMDEYVAQNRVGDWDERGRRRTPGEKTIELRERHQEEIHAALGEHAPVSAAAVDAYGIKLPSGYVISEDGKTYVFKGKPAPAPSGKAAEPDYAKTAAELGIRFDGVQKDSPEPVQFTDTEKSSPAYGATFYLPPGATAEQIGAKLAEKRAQFAEGAARVAAERAKEKKPTAPGEKVAMTPEAVEEVLSRKGAEPPLAPGMVRLYRGEFPERIGAEQAEREASGRFWTRSLMEAGDYGPRIYYKDVPEATAPSEGEVYLAKGQPAEMGAKLYSPAPEDVGNDVFDLIDSERYDDALKLYRQRVFKGEPAPAPKGKAAEFPDNPGDRNARLDELYSQMNDGAPGTGMTHEREKIEGRIRYLEQTPEQRAAAIDGIVRNLRPFSDARDHAFSDGWMAEHSRAKSAQSAQPPSPAPAKPPADMTRAELRAEAKRLGVKSPNAGNDSLKRQIAEAKGGTAPSENAAEISSTDFALAARRMTDAGSVLGPKGTEWNVRGNQIEVAHSVTGREMGTIDLETRRIVPNKASDEAVLTEIANGVAKQADAYAKDAELALLKQYPIKNAKRIRELEQSPATAPAPSEKAARNDYSDWTDKRRLNARSPTGHRNIARLFNAFKDRGIPIEAKGAFTLNSKAQMLVIPDTPEARELLKQHGGSVAREQWGWLTQDKAEYAPPAPDIRFSDPNQLNPQETPNERRTDAAAAAESNLAQSDLSAWTPAAWGEAVLSPGESRIAEQHRSRAERYLERVRANADRIPKGMGELLADGTRIVPGRETSRDGRRAQAVADSLGYAVGYVDGISVSLHDGANKVLLVNNAKPQEAWHEIGHALHAVGKVNVVALVKMNSPVFNDIVRQVMSDPARAAFWRTQARGRLVKAGEALTEANIERATREGIAENAGADALGDTDRLGLPLESYMDMAALEKAKGEMYGERRAKVGDKDAKQLPPAGKPKRKGVKLTPKEAALVQAKLDAGKKVTANTDPIKFVTGIRNLITDTQRELRGLGPAERGPTRPWKTVVLPEAKQRMAAEPAYVDRLIKEMLENPRAVSDTDDAILTIESVKRRVEVEAARQAKDVAREDAAWKAYMEVMNASVATGTREAQSLAARKMLLAQDFSYANQARLEERVKGKPLTEKERAKIEKQTKQYADLMKKLDDVLAKLAEEKASNAQKAAELAQLKDIWNRAIAAMPLTPEGATARKAGLDDFKAKWQARRNKAPMEVQMFAQEAMGQTPGQLSPEDFAGLGKAGSVLFDEGVKDRAAWNARMLADFGSEIETHLDRIYIEAYRQAVETENMAAAKAAKPGTKKPRKPKKKKTPKAELPAAGDEAKLRRFIKQRVEFHVLDGKTDLEDIMASVTDDVRGLGGDFKNMTRVEVGQKFSGYNDPVKPLSQEPPDPKVRELRRLEQIDQGFRTVKEEKHKPWPSGGQRRDKTTPAVRAAARNLRVAIRDAGSTLSGDEESLVSAVEAAERRLSNHIEDMEKAMREGKEMPRAVPRPLTSDKITALKAEQEAVRVRYEEQFNLELKRFKESLAKRISKVKADLDNGAATGDYSKPPRKLTLEERGKYDAEATELAIELQNLRLKLAHKRMTPFDRLVDDIKTCGSFIRTLLQGADASYIRRQARRAFAHDLGSLDLILTGRRKSVFAPVLKGGLLAYFSDAHYEASMADDKNHPEAVAMGKKYNLYTAHDKDTPISRRIEEGMNSRIERIPGIGWLYKAGNRSATIVSNKLLIGLYEQMAPVYRAKGELKTESDERRLMKNIGDMMGRAVMPRSIAARHIIQFTSEVLFSARYALASGRGVLFGYGIISKSSAQRKEGFRTLIGTGMSMAVTLAVISALRAAIGGDDDDDTMAVITNPLLPDFLKGRIGNTRIDLLSGEAQWARFFAQFSYGILNQYGAAPDIIDPKTGKKVKLDPGRIFRNFAASKQAPLISKVKAVLFREGYGGRKIKTREDWYEVISPFPLWVQDGADVFIDQWRKNGDAWSGVMPSMSATVAAWFGESLQTYDEKNTEDRGGSGESAGRIRPQRISRPAVPRPKRRE